MLKMLLSDHQQTLLLTKGCFVCSSVYTLHYIVLLKMLYGVFGMLI